MRNILFLLLVLTTSTFAQEVEIGTIFIIEFNDLENGMEFELVKKNSLQELNDISSLDVILNSKPKENQIIGVFTKGISGNNANSILVLISGLKDKLAFDLESKLPRKRSLQQTPTSPLYKEVMTLQFWSYKVDRIVFKEFRILDGE